MNYSNYTQGGSFGWLLFGVDFAVSLLFTVTIYTLPIVIYRYLIKKRYTERRKARKITVVYAVFAFIVMSLLVRKLNGEGVAGGAIILWSYVNYRILISGLKKENLKRLTDLVGAIIDETEAALNDGNPSCKKVVLDAVPSALPQCSIDLTRIEKHSDFMRCAYHLIDYISFVALDSEKHRVVKELSGVNVRLLSLVQASLDWLEKNDCIISAEKHRQLDCLVIYKSNINLPAKD